MTTSRVILGIEMRHASYHHTLRAVTLVHHLISVYLYLY